MQNLQDKRMGVIRQKGATVRSPVDGKVGAAYVHCLDCKKNVGRAYFMLSYSWGYVLHQQGIQQCWVLCHFTSYFHVSLSCLLYSYWY
jgi:hypothetical protein